MGTLLEFANKLGLPGGTTVATTADILNSGGGGGSNIALGTTMHPMNGTFPAVDATNGPLTADSGIVAGAPSTSGLQLWRWNSGVFRTQGMNWVEANAAVGVGQSSCINASTSRVWSYGTTQGSPFESNHDFAFISDSTTITIWYFHWNGYTSSNYHDIRIFAEHENTLKQVRDANGQPMPKSSTGGGGMFSVTLTMKEARERQYRVMLPSYCYFIGVITQPQATMRKAPNVLMTIQNGDSWQEPNGNIIAPPNGGAFGAGGTFRTMGLAQEIAVATGWVTALVAQGGTGYFNANDPSGTKSETYADAANASVFLSESRTADAINKFGAGNPLWWDIGGWNDGTFPGGSQAAAQSAYQSRVQSGISRLKSKKSDLRIMAASIQPVGDAATLDAIRVGSIAGQKAAYLDAQNAPNVVGFVDMTPMWPNVSMSGARGANVNGSDKIHLTAKGAELVARYLVAGVRNFTIPTAYYHGMLSAA